MIDLDLFLIPQATLTWQLMLGKIGKMTFIWQASAPKRVGIGADFKIFNGNILATSCANMIKIGPVTSEILQGQ